MAGLNIWEVPPPEQTYPLKRFKSESGFVLNLPDAPDISLYESAFMRKWQGGDQAKNKSAIADFDQQGIKQFIYEIICLRYRFGAWINGKLVLYDEHKDKTINNSDLMPSTDIPVVIPLAILNYLGEQFETVVENAETPNQKKKREAAAAAAKIRKAYRKASQSA